MTDFPTLKRECMDLYRQNILPLLADGRPGHLWTGRLELVTLISRIDQWMRDNGMDFEAIALRDDFKAMPASRYTAAQCIAGLKDETERYKAARAK
jgi:hypothetical protein